jgi:hypothetical protein
MTDYPKRTGTAGTMTIRDTGSTVEFWISCSDPATNVGSLPWAISIPAHGYQNSGGANLPSNFRDRLLASYPVTASGTVYFSIGGSGTQGIGGPTDHSAYISRAPTGGVPPAPFPWCVWPNPNQITDTSMRFQFCSAGDGGSPVLYWELLYGIDDVTLETTGTLVQSSGTTTVTGLTPATTYYARARGVNVYGAGPWSDWMIGTTLPNTPPGLSVTPSISGLQATAALTPPGGVTGVTRYDVEYRLSGTTTATSVSSPTSPIVVSGLTPGAIYEWRGRAAIDTWTSVWSAWLPVKQPNPNTSPGDYFDGNTPDTPDVDFTWDGTQNNSTSTATGVGVLGWAAAGVGGRAIIQQVTGGRTGEFAARVTVQTDSTTVRGGMAPVAIGWADIEGGATYAGSVYVQSSKAINLAPEIAWYDSVGALISRTTGTVVAVPASSTFDTRLVVSGVAPAGADHAVALAVGTNLTGGTVFTLDDAMITLASVFPWFSGDSPDTADFDYEWLGAENESESSRSPLDPALTDPLADPDCPPVPVPPGPPVVIDPCIIEVGTWRRYWAVIPASQVARWVADVPTFRLTTGDQPARQVRIRIFPNPDAVSVNAFDGSTGWESEQIVSFIPPHTTLTLDGVSERVRASVEGGTWLAADHLLYGTGGTPATWPLLDCGIGYLVAFDAPLDADAGNLTLTVALTRRF